jgi:Spy/CpxP family protein refolding chaperone
MRKTHVIGIAIISLLTVGSVAQAQTAAPGVPQTRQQQGGRLKEGRGRLLRGIELTAAEKAHVKEIRQKYRAQSATDRQNRRELRQRELAEIRAMLSPAQQTQFDANVKQLNERRAGRKKGRKGNRVPTAVSPGINKS